MRKKKDYMETKQHATKKQWVNEEIKSKIKIKYLKEFPLWLSGNELD